jgi:hypothetical protein
MKTDEDILKINLPRQQRYVMLHLLSSGDEMCERNGAGLAALWFWLRQGRQSRVK